MVEDHSLHHEFEDPEGLKPQELAAMRWQAIEGINCTPGLSQTARRVAIMLITTMNAKTRQSFRGERRIAAELGVHLSAVKKAKVELRDARLISWFNPGGPRHLSHYTFNWAALLREADEAKGRGDEAVKEGSEKRRQGTRAGTYKAPSNSTPQGTNERHDDVTLTAPMVPKTEVQGTQISSQGTLQGTAIVPLRVPDLTLDLPLSDLAQHITPSQATGGLGCAADLDRPFVSQRVREEAEAKGALEGRKSTLPRNVHYQSLLDVFSSDLEVMYAIGRLDAPGQEKASKLLATKNADVAKAFILTGAAA